MLVLNRIYIIGNRGLNLNLKKHRIFVLVGRFLNMGFLRAGCWVIFFLAYT